MTKIWYLFGLAWGGLSLYHWDTFSVSFLREEATVSILVPLKYIWWSSAYMHEQIAGLHVKR